MEDLEAMRARQRGIQHLIPLLNAIRSVAEIAWRRADRASQPLERYAERLSPALANALSALGPGPRAQLLADWSDSRPLGLLVIGSERGLCGAFNDRLVDAALGEVARLAGEGNRVRMLTLGNRPRRLLESAGQEIVYTRDLPSFTVPPYVLAEGIALDLLDLGERGEIGRLVVVSNRPAGRFQYRATTTRLLPPDLPEAARPAGGVQIRPPRDIAALATHLLTEHLLVGLYRLLLASAISEQLARIFTMRNAVDNAQRLLDRLGLTYTMAERQASTAALLEIVAGYELVREQMDPD